MIPFNLKIRFRIEGTVETEDEYKHALQVIDAHLEELHLVLDLMRKAHNDEKTVISFIGARRG